MFSWRTAADAAQDHPAFVPTLIQTLLAVVQRAEEVIRQPPSIRQVGNEAARLVGLFQHSPMTEQSSLVARIISQAQQMTENDLSEERYLEGRRLMRQWVNHYFARPRLEHGTLWALAFMFGTQTEYTANRALSLIHTEGLLLPYQSFGNSLRIFTQRDIRRVMTLAAGLGLLYFISEPAMRPLIMGTLIRCVGFIVLASLVVESFSYNAYVLGDAFFQSSIGKYVNALYRAQTQGLIDAMLRRVDNMSDVDVKTFYCNVNQALHSERLQSEARRLGVGYSV